MDTHDRHRRYEAARVRGELGVHELWLRYVALGGNCDVFDVDGFLQGLLPLDAPEEVVLAVALNERLDEVYRAVRIPIPPAGSAAGTGAVSSLVEDLLRNRPSTRDPRDPPP